MASFVRLAFCVYMSATPSMVLLLLASWHATL